MPAPWQTDPEFGKPHRRRRERERRAQQLEYAASDEEYLEYRYSRDRGRVRVVLNRVLVTLQLLGRRVWSRLAS